MLWTWPISCESWREPVRLTGLEIVNSGWTHPFGTVHGPWSVLSRCLSCAMITAILLYQ